MIQNEPLSPAEKQELKNLGITMTMLSKRYNSAKKRAAYRGQKILPIYDFYREFIRQLKALAKKLNTPADKLLSMIDIHAVNGYEKFDLLLRPSHKILHSEQYRKAAEQVLKKGVTACRYCHKEKPLTDFVRDPRTLTGVISTCKECLKTIRAEKKALEVA